MIKGINTKILAWIQRWTLYCVGDWMCLSWVAPLVLLTESRFVWSFLSYCSDRLELWCCELSPQNSSELRRILRTPTINSQAEWSEERGRWVEGEAAYCRNALLSLWNCISLPLSLPSLFASISPNCFSPWNSLLSHCKPHPSITHTSLYSIPPSKTFACWWISSLWNTFFECAVSAQDI